MPAYKVKQHWHERFNADAANIWLRRTMADVPRPFLTPGYPWVPLLFIVGTAIGLTAIVWGEFMNNNYTPMYGLGIALAGFPVYYVWRRLNVVRG